MRKTPLTLQALSTWPHSSPLKFDCPYCLERLSRDVIGHQPDLLLLAFGLNDAVGGKMEGCARFTDALEAIIDQTRQHAQVDILLLTSPMMMTRRNDAVPACYQHLVEDFMRVQNDNILAAYAECIRQVGQRKQTPVADIYALWQNMAAKGVDTTAMLLNGLNHPNGQGHTLAARAIMDVILAAE